VPQMGKGSAGGGVGHRVSNLAESGEGEEARRCE
jgi:hypothetical protein